MPTQQNKKYLPSTNKKNENKDEKILKDPISDIIVTNELHCIRALRGENKVPFIMVQ